MSQSMMSPGRGISDRSWFGSIVVVPGMKDSRIAPPDTVVQIGQPSLPCHQEIVVRSVQTGHQI